jgi:hypothetical protein
LHQTPARELVTNLHIFRFALNKQAHLPSQVGVDTVNILCDRFGDNCTPQRPQESSVTIGNT